MTQPGSWEPRDLGNFVTQIRGDRLFAMWMLLATTGLTIDRVLELERADVDLQRPVVTPGSARGMRRTFALDPTTREVLRDHVISWDQERDALGHKTQKLFIWSNGEPLDQASADRMYRQHCEAAGLQPVSMHAVRFAYVLAALETGIPTRIIQDRINGPTAEQEASVTRLPSPPQAPSWRRVGGRSLS